jgi:hypothetical protein
MMSNKLVYKKVLVDSAFRLPQSRSSSDFVTELDENMECPEGTRLHITEVSIPATFKTTEVGFFEYLYVMVFDNSDVFVKNFRVYLGNKIYFAEQLAFDMNEGMNSNTTDLSAGGIFSYSYSGATRTVEFKVKEGLNYKLKIPTDVELKNYVNNTWNTTQSNYDSSNPLSINYLLSNYVSTSPLTTWTSSYLNLVPFRAVYINSPELADHHISAPSNYSSSIIRKVLVNEQLGGIINDTSAALSEDYISVGGKNLKRLSFRITDDKSNTLNLYDIPCQFSLIFSPPSY